MLLLFSHSVVSDSFATSCTVAWLASLSMEFPRQEYWSALLQGIFPAQGSNSGHLHCRRFLYFWAIGEAPYHDTENSLKWRSSFIYKFLGHSHMGATPITSTLVVHPKGLIPPVGNFLALLGALGVGRVLILRIKRRCLSSHRWRRPQRICQESSYVQKPADAVRLLRTV